MSDPKKRKKAYFAPKGRGKKSQAFFQLDAGMKGFLITCNNADKRATQEAYHLLNEYADKMYGCEKAQVEKSEPSEDDFESAIREEVEAMQKHNAGPRRFQMVESRTTNCVFIKTTLEHPDDLVTQIFTELCESLNPKSRFILKLYPILGTCRAADDKIEKLAEEVLPPFLTDADGLTYSILFKVRCNNSLSRDVIIELVARVVTRINPSVKVKLDDPDLVISVDILQKICCLSVLKNFIKFKKYNVQEVVSPTPKVAAQSTGTTDSAEKPDAELSEKNELESVDIEEAKASKELQDLSDVKASDSESKLDLPSDSATLKADASCSDTKGGPSGEKNSTEAEQNSSEAERNSAEAEQNSTKVEQKSTEAEPNLVE